MQFAWSTVAHVSWVGSVCYCRQILHNVLTTAGGELDDLQ